MALNKLKEDMLKLIMFGGKGGVGKTTCASSAGLYLSKKGFRTLIISTDPAHSLSDSLGEKIGDNIKQIKGIENLSALEISAEKALSKFKVEYKDQIKKILDTSTYLDQEDIDAVFALPIPGIDEVMGFKTIVDLIDEARFDKYLIDTAPTGHALRLLTLPQLFDDWIKVMAKMRWKYRYMVSSFAGKYTPDEGDDFLLVMKKTVKRIETLIKDPNKCEFVAVTIPEEMAVLETRRLLTSLAGYGLKVRHMVVNNVVESGGCEFCRQRRKGQEKYISSLKKEFKDLDMTMVPLQPQEVKGIDALMSIEKFLF